MGHSCDAGWSVDAPVFDDDYFSFEVLFRWLHALDRLAEFPFLDVLSVFGLKAQGNKSEHADEQCCK